MTITIAKLLDRNEYDVRFVVIGRQIGEIKDFVPKGYHLSQIRIRNIYDFTTLRMYRYLKKIRPSYVFCSLHYLNSRVIQAARWVGGCKVIVRFNCAVERVYGINKLLTQITYPKADVIIAQTEKMQEDLLEAFDLPIGKVIAIHNLIDKDTIREKLRNIENPYKGEKNKVIVWVGRFNPVKGADLVVNSFIETYRNRSDICLYLVGKVDEQNEYYQSVKNLADESVCKSNIHFVGFQSNPYKWMKYADCYVLSSRSEGSPNSLFEALYLGVPSVATRCTPNLDEIIFDGVNGYQADVGDNAAMAVCIIKALQLSNVNHFYSHSTENDFKRLFI